MRTQIYFGLGTGCPDITLHHIFPALAHMSSKDTSPDVEQNLFLREDVEGNSSAEPATIAANEPQSRSWILNAMFDPLHHPDLVFQTIMFGGHSIRLFDWLGIIFVRYATKLIQSEQSSYNATQS